MSSFNIPTRHNQKLKAVVTRIDADEELWQLWRCANVNAMDRSDITDHGEIHIRVVANAALKMLRLLSDAGIQTSIEANYDMTKEDSEVVVVLAACMHDLGISIHRDDHEQYSLFLARLKLPHFLEGLYDVREQTIMISRGAEARRRATHPSGNHHGQLGRRVPGRRAPQTQVEEFQHRALRGGDGSCSR
jgi:metal-dependent HD superfamily phosphatase/phosphodiesterase